MKITMRKSVNIALKYWTQIGSIRYVRTGLNMLKWTVVGACVMDAATSIVGYPAFIHGKSMQPEFNAPTTVDKNSTLLSWTSSFFSSNSDWVWVSCWKARNFTFSRGDIVIYISPKDPCEYVIKRVIGLENDTVTLHCKPPVKITVPPGHLWVEGDNWSVSVDSNKYGPVPQGLIFGVATHVIWPIHKLRKLEEGIPASLQPSRVDPSIHQQRPKSRSWLQKIKVFLYFCTN